MTPLRRFAITLSPFLVLGACSELIGLSDFEKGDVPEGEGGEDSGGGSGGKGGKGGSSGSSGNSGGGTSSGGRGGNPTGGKGGGEATGGTSPGGDGGDAGMGGEPEGGTAGRTGGTGGRGGATSGGTGGGGKGGTGGAGQGGMGGAGQGGMGGAGQGGMGGGGQGGSGGSACTTVPVTLRGAGFDTDTAAWVPYDDGMGPSIPIIVPAGSEGIMAVSSPNVAHLAGENGMGLTDYYAGQFQTITIPVGAVTLTITGSRYMQSEEASTSTTIYDRMYIQMYEDAIAATGYVGQFMTVNNTSTPRGSWVMFSGSVAVQAWAGQSVDLDMWARADSSLVTDFYLDSLALTAFVCP